MAKAGRGISSRIPSSRLISVGVPQPSFAIGPIRKRPSHRREDALEVADDARRVGDDVAREEDVLSVPSRTPARSASNIDRAVEAEQAADADQREAEAELDRRELGGDDDQEREAAAAVGHLRVDDADGLEVE